MRKPLVCMTAISLLLLTGCMKSNNETTQKTSDSHVTTKKEQTREEKIAKLNQQDLPQLDQKVRDNEYLVQIQTTKGNIEARLFPKEAPKAVENFVTHAKEGYYDGLIFHRVIDNFMIQTGDPKGDGTGGESIWKKPFKDELSNHLYNLRGAIAMANSGPDTNGSQFFINQNKDDRSQELLIDDYPQKIIDAYKKGGNPELDYADKESSNDYTVFGQVTKGLSVVDDIASVKTDSSDKPTQDIKIKKIVILKEPKKTDNTNKKSD